MRDYGTATWEGGKNGCEHKKENRAGVNASAGNTLSGESDFYIDTCSKCEAKRIDNQLGLEKTPEEFVENCVKWAREVWRILRNDGTFFLNLGDSYNGSVSDGGKNSLSGGGSLRPHGRSQVANKSLKRDCPSLKPKDLCGIPWRVAFALQADGWYLRSAMPWVKR